MVLLIWIGVEGLIIISDVPLEIPFASVTVAMYLPPDKLLNVYDRFV